LKAAVEVKVGAERKINLRCYDLIKAMAGYTTEEKEEGEGGADGAVQKRLRVLDWPLVRSEGFARLHASICIFAYLMLVLEALLNWCRVSSGLNSPFGLD
jgi:hypothetical protein